MRSRLMVSGSLFIFGWGTKVKDFRIEADITISLWLQLLTVQPIYSLQKFGRAKKAATKQSVRLWGFHGKVGKDEPQRPSRNACSAAFVSEGASCCTQ